MFADGAYVSADQRKKRLAALVAPGHLLEKQKFRGALVEGSPHHRQTWSCQVVRQRSEIESHRCGGE